MKLLYTCRSLSAPFDATIILLYEGEKVELSIFTNKVFIFKPTHLRIVCLKFFHLSLSFKQQLHHIVSIGQELNKTEKQSGI